MQDCFTSPPLRKVKSSSVPKKKAHFTVLVEALVMNSRWTANLREMMDDMHKALGPRLSLNIF